MIVQNKFVKLILEHREETFIFFSHFFNLFCFADIPRNEEPLQIIHIVSSENENGDILHELELNEENLSRIMLRPDVKDNIVMIVSIAGALRMGKSFLLGFILKYLEAEVTT